MKRKLFSGIEIATELRQATGLILEYCVVPQLSVREMTLL